MHLPPPPPHLWHVTKLECIAASRILGVPKPRASWTHKTTLGNENEEMRRITFWYGKYFMHGTSRYCIYLAATVFYRWLHLFLLYLELLGSKRTQFWYWLLVVLFSFSYSKHGVVVSKADLEKFSAKFSFDILGINAQNWKVNKFSHTK